MQQSVFIANGSKEELERRLRSIKWLNRWWVRLPIVAVVAILAIPFTVLVSAPIVVLAAWILETFTGRDWSGEVVLAIAVLYVLYFLREGLVGRADEREANRQLRARIQDRIDELSGSLTVKEPSWPSQAEYEASVAHQSPAQIPTFGRTTATMVSGRSVGIAVPEPDLTETWPEAMRRLVRPLRQADRDMPAYLGTGLDFIVLSSAAWRLGVSWLDVDRLIQDGKLRTYQIGGTIHLSATEVDRFKNDGDDDDDGTAGVPALI